MTKRFDKSQLKVSRLAAAEIGRKLRRYESIYKMGSAEFYAKFHRGELEEKPDYLRWASYYDMAARANLLKVPVEA